MEDNRPSFVIWWKKYGDPFTAISILLFLAFSVVMILNDQEIKKEISLSCGYGEDDYYCYCEKSKAMEIKNKLDSDGKLPILEWENFSISG